MLTYGRYHGVIAEQSVCALALADVHQPVLDISVLPCPFNRSGHNYIAEPKPTCSQALQLVDTWLRPCMMRS